MLHYTCLFAHDHPSTPNTDWDPDNGHFDGWAEWFKELPLLFLYLIGDAVHLPQAAPFAAYGQHPANGCLMTPMHEVRQRWARLSQQLQSTWPQLSLASQSQWTKVNDIITASTRQWLVLDLAMLPAFDDDIGSPEFDAALEDLRQRCADWRLEDDAWPAPLQPLLERFEAQGWWSPAAIARRYEVEAQEDPNFPSKIQEKYVLTDRNGLSAWDREAQAYRVQSRKRPTHFGLVTEYGRWLIHPDDSAIHEGLCAHNGWIVVKTQKGSGIKDINGQWVIPPSADYEPIVTLSPTLMACSAASDGDNMQIRRLPDGQLLFDHLKDSIYRGDDSLWRITHADGTLSVLDAQGQVQFNGPYDDIQAINKKNGLAVVSLHDEESGLHKEGVVHISGQRIVPCEYGYITRGNHRAPPKSFPGGKLLAMTLEGRLHVYSTQGKLLAAPDLLIHMHTWPTIKNNHILAFDGTGPKAETVWFSLKDFSVERTRQSRLEYLGFGKQNQDDGDVSEAHQLTREELIAKENPK